MIDEGDLIAAINALEGLTAGGVFVMSVYATHFAAARGYLQQAIALLEAERKEGKE